MERVNLIIGGKAFPVQVDRSEIEELKEIEGLVNKKINEFVVKYPGYEKIDILTMAFLSVIFEIQKSVRNKDVGALEERLEKITDLLDKSL